MDYQQQSDPNMGHIGPLHSHPQSFLDDPALFQPNMLDINPSLDFQYSSRFVGYPEFDSSMSGGPIQQQQQQQFAPMDDLMHDLSYVPEDSQLLGNSVPVRSDSATSDDRGAMSNNAYSSNTSQSSATPPQTHKPCMNPTAMVDSVLESTLSPNKISAAPTVSTTAQPQPQQRKNANPITSLPDEIADCVFLVNPAGKVVHCNNTVSTSLGWPKDKLVGEDIQAALHPEDVAIFHNTLKEAASRSRKFKTHTRFANHQSAASYELFEVIGTPYSSELADSDPSAPIHTECRGIVLNCRPYPSPQTAQFDGFLQLSTDNLWLKRQLNRVGSNAPEPFSFQDATARIKGPAGVSEWVDDIMGVSSESGWASPASEESEPNQPDLLKYYYPDADATQRANPPSAPSSGGSSKSKKDKRVRKPVSKTKDGDYICTECGTMSSPEWRKGPQGRKTLCNACGLRWSKQTKKMQQS